MNDQQSFIDRVSRVTGEVAGSPVVSGTRQRAQRASRVAKAQLPATREDLARLQEQLDRIESALTELAARVEPAKPKRRAASASGSAKTQG
jgi:ubiquinone biosynthesis protein UbiJ